MATDVNKILANQIYDNEVLIAKSNQDQMDSDYESYLGIIDHVRDEKEYEWQSDIRMPEMVSHHLSQSAIDVGQYFGTRDFVEVKINDPSPEAKAAAEASKELINRTLNKRKLNHYQKFVRGKGICNLSGRVYLKFWWERETESQQVGTTLEIEQLDHDINGRPLEYEWQQPATKQTEKPIFGEVAIRDCFNYDVWDQRNVFVSDDYAYTLQEKEWIIFRSEVTLSDLEADAENNEYFNIELLGEPPEITDTKQESYEKGDISDSQLKENSSLAERGFDLYERYGKYWVVETKNGVKPGIDVNGNILEKATYEEVIITIVKNDSSNTLIGLKKTPFIDADGQTYRPCARGLCYIHPSIDSGMGDGQNTRELQTAMDDTFNASQDRVLLATFPSFKGARQSIEDNHSIYVAPGHTMELQDINDLQEFRVSDNIAGALSQLQYLENKSRQVDTMNETTTGGVPSIASTTATAVQAATASSNTRVNYKSMTFEYTALLEMYWMIQQMTYAFATDETGFELMGDKLRDFNPSLEYYYTPLTQSIETEASKAAKRREWIQLYQISAQIQHPDTPKRLNQIYGEIVKLMGDEYESIILLDEKAPVQQGGQQGQAAEGAVSNQYGIEQSPEEVYARAN